MAGTQLFTTMMTCSFASSIKSFQTLPILMLFVPTAPLLPCQLRRALSGARRRHPCRLRRSCRVFAPYAALSEPEQHRDARYMPPSSAWGLPPNEHEYDVWSPDFLELCSAQLQLLCATTQTSCAVLFFRRENRSTGALEFVPLVARSPFSSDDSRRVWIASPVDAGHTALEGLQPNAKYLPGGIPAQWLLPDYPFIHPSAGGERLPDGRLCVPVEYNGVLAGTIVLVPAEVVPPDTPAAWDQDALHRATTVAKTIALAAAMEGRWHASLGALDVGRSLMQSMRSLLRTTLHQIRSPVSALVTFGHVMLRKLPPGNSNRVLAKNMILEALRVDELLQPLDDVGKSPMLPEATRETVPWYARDGDASFLDVGDVRGTAIKPAALGGDASTDGQQMLWLSDVLVPQLEIFRVLVEEKGMTFHSYIDDDSPPVMAVEKYVREVVSNLVDNAIKYSPNGARIGVGSYGGTGSADIGVNHDGASIVVWDTGYGFAEDEVGEVWKLGFRGTAAEQSGSAGSGIGLSNVRDMLHALDANVRLLSPLPSHLDPRGVDSGDLPKTPGSAFVLEFERAFVQ